jgi:hypothetical protein
MVFAKGTRIATFTWRKIRWKPDYEPTIVTVQLALLSKHCTIVPNGGRQSHAGLELVELEINVQLAVVVQ